MIKMLISLVFIAIFIPPATPDSLYTVYITDTGTKYHNIGCHYLNSSQHSVQLSWACSNGYTPCSVCDPVSCSFAEVENQTQSAPREFSLSQNYPNPFNASTTFRFWSDRPQTVRLEVFDITGKLIRVPFSGAVSAGEQSVTINACDLASGNYFAVFSGEKQRVTRKMVLVR